MDGEALDEKDGDGDSTYRPLKDLHPVPEVVDKGGAGKRCGSSNTGKRNQSRIKRKQSCLLTLGLVAVSRIWKGNGY